MYSLFFLNDFIGKAETFPLILNENLLVIILSIPLFSIFFIFFTPELSLKKYYIFSLYSTVLSFLTSLYLWYMFNSTVGGFQFIYSFQVIPSLPFALRFGVDGISIFFILLTNLFIYLCILSLNTSTYKIKEVLWICNF